MKSQRGGRIRFEAKGIRSSMTVRDDSRYDSAAGVNIDAWLEPIRNLVTGKVHRAIIELPEGVESNRMDQASTKKLLVNDSLLNFRYEGTYEVFLKIFGRVHRNTWVLWFD
jgi:hypothetical protein